jgi:hypothetical protein
MAHTNDEIDELNSLKHAASERRTKRAKPASNKRAAPHPPAGTEEEVALAQAELVSLKQELHRFIRNPVDSLLSSLIGPLLSAVTRVLGANKK